MKRFLQKIRNTWPYKDARNYFDVTPGVKVDAETPACGRVIPISRSGTRTDGEVHGDTSMRTFIGPVYLHLS